MSDNTGLVFVHNGKEHFSLDSDLLAQTPPRHMIITGLGRGGTTACAIMLEALGFKMESPTVYRESKHLMRLIRNREIDNVLAHLATWNKSSDRMAWKDPKLHGHGSIEVLNRLPDEFGVMVVFRDPLKIAIRRAQFHKTVTLEELMQNATALKKMTQAISQLRGRKLILVSYESLLLETQRMVGTIAQYLKVTDAAAITRAVESIKPSPREYREAVSKSKAALESGMRA
jgi:hypothetical protein